MPGIDGADEPTLQPRLRIDWAEFQLFLAVAETGSFSGAARALRLSQPTVSQRARDLEGRMGAYLFLRGTTGIGLTEAGKRMLEHVQAMNRSAAAIGNLVSGGDRRDEGRVRLKAPDGVASFWLAPRLARLQERHPKLQITLEIGSWPDTPVDAEIEVAIQFEENRDPDNVVIPLGVSHYLPFAAQSYLDTYGTPRSIRELAQHRAIRHAGEKLKQQGTWSAEVAALDALATRGLQTNSSTAVLHATRAGAGIAVLPSTAALFAPELVPLEPAPLVTLRKWLVYNRDVGQIGRARRVIEWIKEIYDPRTNPWFRSEFVHPRDFPQTADSQSAGPDAQILPVRAKVGGRAAAG